MVSTKPYLLRAIYEWCIDEGFTPYLSVIVDVRTRVPREHVRDGQIVLNIGPEATNQLQMGNEDIVFHARFNGVAFPVVVPVGAVAAIFAKENGQGMAFEPEVVTDVELPAEEVPVELDEGKQALTPPSTQPPGGRPHLTRIK